MSIGMVWQTKTSSAEYTEKLGELLGKHLKGGEVIDLVSDLGGGKTTFVHGLAKGLGSKDQVASPTFTLSRVYKARGGIEIHHFDFYRLSEPGILKDQLQESLEDEKVVTVIEWSDIVKGVLPANRLTIKFKPDEKSSESREIEYNYNEAMAPLIKTLETEWTEVEP